MSRINYSDDEDFQNQSMFWEANQERSIRGQKGQVALRELEAALLALPEKRLIAEELENAAGEVCAIGALVKFKGGENPRVVDDMGQAPLGDGEILWEEVEEATLEAAQGLGVPRLVALAVVYQNDDEWRPFTPEQRYDKMLRWVQNALSGRYGWLTKPST